MKGYAVLQMQGKYSSLPHYLAARAVRTWQRYRIANLVSWPDQKTTALRPGVTAIIGMCHRLPEVLLANLKCLSSNAWSELEEVIVVVDSVPECLPDGLERRAIEVAHGLNLRFLYYTEVQSKRADRLCLPFVYAWLSWTIGIAHCKTKTALFHDYDALILDDTLARRYRSFVASGVKVQGIRWYSGSGIEVDDRLATTFETFFDIEWVRRFPPINLFHKVSRLNGKTVDFDILLYLQANFTVDQERTIYRMSPDSLVHPSQMIHQFTMARRHPGAALPVYSLPMIPFFEWLGGAPDALTRATDRLSRASSKLAPFFDELHVNFSKLDVAAVDWCLKQMIQVCEVSGIDPTCDLYNYGTQLYQIAGSKQSEVWKGDFTPSQRGWIMAAAPDDTRNS